MTLHETAAADLENIIEDDQTGFGWPMTIIDPDGNSASVVGMWTDIGHEIDADGVIHAGRTASITVRIEALTDAGLGLPVNVPDENSKPWTVSTTDATGAARVYKVRDPQPDLRRGVVTCGLEVYEEL